MRRLKLVLHDEIFFCNLSCNDVARKVAGRFQLVTWPLCNLSHNFFGDCNDCTEYNLVLHGESFLVTCFANLKKKIIASCISHFTGCNLGQQFAIVSKQSMQWLQSCTLCNHCKPTNVARQVAKRACYTVGLASQRHCSTSCKENCTL